MERAQTCMDLQVVLGQGREGERPLVHGRLSDQALAMGEDLTMGGILDGIAAHAPEGFLVLVGQEKGSVEERNGLGQLIHKNHAEAFKIHGGLEPLQQEPRLILHPGLGLLLLSRSLEDRQGSRDIAYLVGAVQVADGPVQPPFRHVQDAPAEIEEHRYDVAAHHQNGGEQGAQQAQADHGPGVANGSIGLFGVFRVDALDLTSQLIHVGCLILAGLLQFLRQPAIHEGECGIVLLAHGVVTHGAGDADHLFELSPEGRDSLRPSGHGQIGLGHVRLVLAIGRFELGLGLPGLRGSGL